MGNSQSRAPSSSSSTSSSPPATETSSGGLGNSFLAELVSGGGELLDEAGDWLGDHLGLGSGPANAPAAAPVAPPLPLFEVTDGYALIRDPSFKSTGRVIPKGSMLRVHERKDRFVKVSTAPGAAGFAAAESDQIWTASSNLSSQPAAAVTRPAPGAAPKVVTSPTQLPGAANTEPDLLDQAWSWMTREAKEVAGWFTPGDDGQETTAPGAAPAQAGPAVAPAAGAGAGAGPAVGVKPNTPPPAALFPQAYTVMSDDARIRDAAGKSGTGKLAKGTKVYILAAKGTLVHVATGAGATVPVTAEQGVWIQGANLGGAGADVGLGNERTDQADATKAQAIKDGLPPGRKPGQSPYNFSFGSDFQTSLDGISLSGSLLGKLKRMCEWAIQNDMVAGNIVFGSGMRSPAKAHQMCTAWEIQYGPGRVTMDAVKALSNGKDADGNTWYQPGWTWAQVQANANTIRSSSAIAAAGYPAGHAKRAPLPASGSPGVSRHCSGGAIDVTIPWRTKGKDASTNAQDVWGYENIYEMFGLYRALPKGTANEEHWHIQESGKKLEAEAGASETVA